MAKQGNRKYNTKIILILGTLTTLVPFSVDTYLPAVPKIAEHFGTTAAIISFSLSTFFAGFAIGQIIYGPLLDRFGRKKPLYFGLSLSILSSVACMLSGNDITFMVFRFIQALGASVATVAAITMVRDFFSQEESAKVFSLLILVIGTSPLLAPTIGGAITAHIGWEWIFVLLSLLAALLMVVVFFFLPVKYQANAEISLKVRHQAARYISILKTHQFLAYALAGAFSFATLFVYVAGSPIIFIQVFKVSPQTFGGIFALLSAAFIGGSQLNILLLRKFKSKQIFRTALTGQVVSSLVFMLGTLNGWYGQNAIILLLFIILLCLGFTSPNAIALALENVTENLGSASALIGTIRIGIAGLASSSIGLFHTTDIFPVAFMMMCTAVVAMIVFIVGKAKSFKLLTSLNRV